MIDAVGVSLANDTQSVMVREISEPAVSRPNRSSFSLAVIGALALALPLSACGRKGALDPPPGGSQLEAGTVRTPVTRRGAVRDAGEADRNTMRMAGRSLPRVEEESFPPIG